MAKPIDLELKKAFMELQAKMIETSKKIQVIDSQIQVLKKIKQHVELTDKEISNLPPETKTYESIGRMFLHTSLVDIKKNLKNKSNNVATKASEFEKSKQYLEKNLKESEDNLREMIQQKKDTKA